MIDLLTMPIGYFYPWDFFVTSYGHTTNHIMGLSKFPGGKEKQKK